MTDNMFAKFLPFVLIALTLAGCSCSSFHSGESFEPVSSNDLFPGTVDLTDNDPSVSHVGIGLAGQITSSVVIDKLSPSGETMVLLGTSVGLYVASQESLRHVIYTPYGISDVALIDDISGDGVREVIVSFNRPGVSPVRCYDGLTWELVWHCSPNQEVFVERMGWCDITLDVTDLTVGYANGNQYVAVTSGRSLFCIDARSGELLWKSEASSDLDQLAVIGDQNGDLVDELVVGSRSGEVYVYSGRTGKMHWHDLVAGEYVDSGQYEDRTHQSSIHDIIPVDAGKGRVIVSSGDGRVYLLDAWEQGDYLWSMSIILDDYPGLLRITEAPDVTGDGEPEIVVADCGTDMMNERDWSLKVDSSMSTTFYGEAVESAPRPPAIVKPMPNIEVWGVPTATEEVTVVLLDGTTGEVLWENDLHTYCESGVQIVMFENRPVIIDSEEETVNLIDLVTGEPLSESLDTSSWIGNTGIVRQLSEDSYVMVSDDSDVIAISSADHTLGDVLWRQPRLDSVTVEVGCLTKSGGQDYLVCGNHGQSTRVLAVVDEATHDESWRYEVEFEEFAESGGLNDVEIIPDITTDGVQEIIAFLGEDLIIFDGDDGSQIEFYLGSIGLESSPISYGDEGCLIAASTHGEVVVFSADDGQLDELWRGAYGDWGSSTYGNDRFEVVDDLNEDGISELAVFLSNQIIILESVIEGDVLHYDAISPPLIEAQDDAILYFREMIRDIDGDGIREIACSVLDRRFYGEEAWEYHDEEVAFLVVTPIDGSVLFELDGDRECVTSLACADFNGDDYLDSIVFWSAELYHRDSKDIPGPELEVISGRDGSSLWSYTFMSRWVSNEVPATSIADVSGDGIDDIAFTVEESGDTSIMVYDITNHEQISETQVSEFDMQNNPSYVKAGEIISTDPIYPGGVIRTIGDTNGDGYEEVVINESIGAGVLGVGHNGIAVVDLFGEGGVSGFLGINTDIRLLFETIDAELIGMPYDGGVCFLNMASSFRLVSPSEGDLVDSPLRIDWDGVSDDEHISVTVDGIPTNAGDARIVLSPGDHNIVIHSVDEYGRVCYESVLLEVRHPLWGYILPVVIVGILLGLAVVLFGPRLIQKRRIRARRSTERLL
ncbi:MAG: PQQ-binding-like beta-propeller repeat protein [Chloroflexota bacterium]|nr:PQQ-binding-like beta-propeller repeat protein [Chloroflexota bacterium]